MSSIMRCVSKDGKPGWKWGAKGTCHTGRLGKAKALRDTVAKPKAKSSKKKKPSAKKSDEEE